MEWWYLAFAYLVTGFCTQLPGVVYGHFLQLSYFCNLQYSGSLAKFMVGVVWLIFTSVLWPIPFLRAGLNYIALELVSVGILSVYIVVKWAFTPVADTLIVILAGVLSVFLARPEKKWPTII